MNIVVFVKHVPYASFVTIAPDGKSIAEEDLLYVTNPCDLQAIEAAVRIKEQFPGSHITAISMGTPSARKTLQRCLAAGADRAVLLCDPAFANSDSYATAKVLARSVRSVKYDLIMCGSMALDTQAGQVGAAVAEFLDLPLVSGVVGIRVSPGGSDVVVERKLERGSRENVRAGLPVLLTVEAGLNEPRYADLPSLMAALKKGIEQMDIKALGLSPEEVGASGSNTVTVKMSPPKPRPKKIFIPDSGLSAADRLRSLMSGGAAERKTSLLEGEPDEVAARLVQWLVQQKVVPPAAQLERLNLGVPSPPVSLLPCAGEGEKEKRGH